MLISLIIFFVTKSQFPNPGKKEAAAAVTYSAEEKAAMAKEIKQRLYALFAVLGVVIFFWFSFHQMVLHFHSLRETSLIHRQSLRKYGRQLILSLLLH